jgi:hypothetical protein
MVTTGLSQIGLAICYLISVETAVLAFPKRKGLISSVLLFVSSISGTIFDLINAIYVNPSNVEGDKCLNVGTIDEW